MISQQEMTPNQAAGYPLIPLRRLVICPFMQRVVIYIGRPFSLAAVRQALSKDNMILLAMQQDPEVETPPFEHISTVGTLARVTDCESLNDELMRVRLEGVERARISQIECTDDGWQGIAQIAVPAEIVRHTEQLAKRLKLKIGKLLDLINGLPTSTNILAERFLDCVSVGPVNLPDFADRLADYLYGDIEDRQRYLEMFSVQERLAHLNKVLEKELRSVRRSVRRSSGI